ncbi:hypothetical protein C0J52_00784 [Blattella germanica]|nr:hypothetical protein C0J52_00784 [Blattella germanica]
MAGSILNKNIRALWAGKFEDMAFFGGKILVSLISWRTACNLLFHLSFLPSIERATSNNFTVKRSTEYA